MASNKVPVLATVLNFYSSAQVINISIMHEIIYLQARALGNISVLFECCKFNERKFFEPTNYAKLFLTTQVIRNHGNIQQVHVCSILMPITYISGGPVSVVGIATGYGLDVPGIETRWGPVEIFRTCPDRPWGPPSLLYNGYWVFPGGKERPGRDTDPLPPSSAVVKKW
jgi:hypothetical protein